MKEIKIVCFNNGTAQLTTGDTHFDNENLATRLEIDFSKTDYSDKPKWVDIIVNKTIGYRYELGTDEIVSMLLTSSVLVNGEMVITPIVYDGELKVKYRPNYTVGIIDQQEAIDVEPGENSDFIFQLKARMDELENTAIKDFDDLETHPTTLEGYGITDVYDKTEIGVALDLKADNTTVSDLDLATEKLVNKKTTLAESSDVDYPTVKAVKDGLDLKVDKVMKIIGIDLQNDILIDEFKTALGKATQSLDGLLSAEDKKRLDTIYASFNDTDENNVVDKISEILAIFENYPEADAIVTALSSKVDKTTTINTKALSDDIVLSGADLLVGGSTSANAAALISVAFKTLEDVDDTKVDKVDGKALSTNDYTDEEKTKLTGIKDGAQVNVIEKIKIDGIDLTPDIDKRITLPNKVASVNGKMGVVVLNQDDIGDGATYKRVTDVEKDYWDGKVDTVELEEHNDDATAHLSIRQEIEEVVQDVNRIQGRGKSYGELDYRNSYLLSISEVVRNTFIYTNIRVNYPDYTLNNGDLVYTREVPEENTYEWEYNSTLGTWVDNGAYTVQKASNTIFGLVKGDSDYINIVNGILQILKSDYATRVGTDLSNSYTYSQLKTFIENLQGKVDKVDGKGLSENDYTTTEKNKLEGIEEGAEVNTVSPMDLDSKLNTENPDFTGVMYYEGEEALKIIKALEGMGCTINASGNDTEEKCIAAEGEWVEVNVVNGDNIFIGPDAGNVNVGQGKVWAYQGTGNYAFGAEALNSLLLGKFNIAVGPSALKANTEGDFNIAIGRAALLKNSIGNHLIAIGDSAFFSAIDQMIEGVAIGYQAFGQASQGSENVALGYRAGLRTEDDSYVTTVNKGVFLGGRTRAKNSTSNNEIVIGNRAIGNGDNTITVGNDEIEKTYLKGDVYLEEDKKVKSNAIPTDEEDLVNKEYVDTALSSLSETKVDKDELEEHETDPIFTAWNKSTGISITKSQVSDLIEATQALSGLMSATDKTRLDVLHALLEEDTANSVVDSINEVLAIFNNYPEGADLVTALAGKVDKVTDKGLSTNDYTTTEKTKLSGIETGAEVNEVNSVNGKQGAVVLDQDDIGDGATYKRVSQAEKNTWNNKQDKLVAGANITIDENTNTISASGGSGGTVDWQDVENKPELYNKTEIDLMLGDIESALDAILGV